MLFRSNLCRDQKEWPRDTQKQTFLLRVIHQVGKNFFGAQWTGQEPDCELVVPNTEDGAAALSLWQEYNATINSSPPHMHARQPFLGETQNDDFIDRLIRIVISFEEAVASANARFNKAAEIVVDACCNEKLTTCLRPLEGGNYSAPLSASLWNFENWHRRLYEGRLDPVRPFEVSWFEHETQWIFVESKSVQLFLDTLRPSAGATVGIISNETRCKHWLMEQMKFSPFLKPRPKVWFCKEAMETFSVSKRGFDRIWDLAARETHSNWKKPGRPKQSH